MSIEEKMVLGFLICLMTALGAVDYIANLGVLS